MLLTDTSYAVYVLGINVTATLTGSYVKEGKLYDTGDRTVYLGVTLLCLLVKQLQPYARCKSQLIAA